MPDASLMLALCEAPGTTRVYPDGFYALQKGRKYGKIAINEEMEEHTMTLEIAEKQDYQKIKALYLSAFPPEERPPFFFLKRKAGQMLVAKEDERFLGFVNLICHKDLVYLFFFALEAPVRGQGYGSQILQLVKAQNEGKRIFLAREPLDDQADNAAQRHSRHQFYLRNGFTDLPIQIVEQGYVFDAMGIGGSISAKDYDGLINGWCGKFLRSFLRMHVIEHQ